MTVLNILVLGGEKYRVAPALITPNGVQLRISGDGSQNYLKAAAQGAPVGYKLSTFSSQLAQDATRGEYDAVVIFDNPPVGAQLAKLLSPEVRLVAIIAARTGKVVKRPYAKIEGITRFANDIEGVRDFLAMIARVKIIGAAVG